MLNTEYADFEEGNPNIIKIGFTDSDGDFVVEIQLPEDDAFKLGKMLIDQTNMIAKRKRCHHG